MNITATAVYFIITILEIHAKTSDVIHDIGSKLCPHTSFCQRNATPYYKPGVFKRPCCSKCSCEDDCWKTSNCCPDKNVIKDQEPVTKCTSVIVKKADGFREEFLGYHVIDYCPMNEKNTSLVNKCTSKQTTDFEDVIWVSDEINATIYRNKFCAECHHVTSNVTEFLLEAKCTNDVYTSLGDFKSFLLSNKCQLTVREPHNMYLVNFTRCEVPQFTTCNQTGLWQDFDADVKWACDAFEAPFFVQRQDMDQFGVDAYQNAYCYVCNVNSVEHTDVLCPLPGYDPLDLGVFSSLIDYKRYQETDDQERSTTETICKSYEIMDKIMHKCRLLKCPFGSSPVNGKCKSLFEGTSGLYIDIQFALSVVWSRSEYKMTDKASTLRTLAENIIGHFVNESRFNRNETQCPYCNMELQMMEDVNGDNDFPNTGLDDKEHGVNGVVNSGIEVLVKEDHENEKLNTEQKVSLPEFIIQVVFFTVPQCQLQDIYDIATGMFGKVIEVKADGASEMLLKVELFKDSLNQTFNVLKAMKSEFWNCKVKDAYTLKDDRLCPKISITHTEFEPHLTNANTGVIRSFFEEKHIATGEPNDAVQQYIKDDTGRF